MEPETVPVTVMLLKAPDVLNKESIVPVVASIRANSAVSPVISRPLIVPLVVKLFCTIRPENVESPVTVRLFKLVLPDTVAFASMTTSPVKVAPVTVKKN